ncbi:hypothetical protein CEUSTIGMA_g897.t1 [Chlamydomonas eustigma]|uniref:Uncharacterized protein n=1 Tax=Chlamydomonas eustigma TaxID=1157962 RepID=A0A250WRI0_9CHLO|nr:hypothetical protein CEUSTIGMA_g897.t1 [Chlamydomonas eustigma]|eukprot:GAX73445.1 hypothetical protein CEUSTIGMA_g897.t1 [Chlamydomonas eustigma]
MGDRARKGNLTCNPVLARRWYQHDYDLHRKKLSEVHSMTDSSKPLALSMTHIRPDNSKALYFKSLQEEELVRENERLLQQLGKILFSSAERKYSTSPFGGSNNEYLLFRSNLQPGSIPPGTRLDQNQVPFLDHRLLFAPGTQRALWQAQHDATMERSLQVSVAEVQRTSRYCTPKHLDGRNPSKDNEEQYYHPNSSPTASSAMLPEQSLASWAEATMKGQEHTVLGSGFSSPSEMPTILEAAVEGSGRGDTEESRQDARATVPGQAEQYMQGGEQYITQGETDPQSQGEVLKRVEQEEEQEQEDRYSEDEERYSEEEETSHDPSASPTGPLPEWENLGQSTAVSHHVVEGTAVLIDHNIILLTGFYRHLNGDEKFHVSAVNRRHSSANIGTVSSPIARRSAVLRSSKGSSEPLRPWMSSSGPASPPPLVRAWPTESHSLNFLVPGSYLTDPSSTMLPHDTAAASPQAGIRASSSSVRRAKSAQISSPPQGMLGGMGGMAENFTDNRNNSLLPDLNMSSRLSVLSTRERLRAMMAEGAVEKQQQSMRLHSGGRLSRRIM